MGFFWWICGRLFLLGILVCGYSFIGFDLGLVGYVFFRYLVISVGWGIGEFCYLGQQVCVVIYLGFTNRTFCFFNQIFLRKCVGDFNLGILILSLFFEGPEIWVL